MPSGLYSIHVSVVLPSGGNNLPQETPFCIHPIPAGHIGGLVQGCSNCSTSAIESLQSCAKSSIYGAYLRAIHSDWHLIGPSVAYMSRGCWDFVSVIDVQSMVCENDRVHYGLWVVFPCLHITLSHYQHYADLSEGIVILKCLSGICCWVCA